MKRKGRIAYRRHMAEAPSQSLGDWVEATSFFCQNYGSRSNAPADSWEKTWTPDQQAHSRQVLEQDFEKMRVLQNVSLANELMVNLK